MIVEKNKKQKK